MAFLSGYAMYTFSNIIVFIGLATLLHLQFGRTGIVNFGVVGFFGLGMYSFGVFLIQYNIPYFPAMLMAMALTGGVAWALGKLILDLDSQSILVATLAFATIIADLVTTEKKYNQGSHRPGNRAIPFRGGSVFPGSLFSSCVVVYRHPHSLRAKAGKLSLWKTSDRNSGQ